MDKCKLIELSYSEEIKVSISLAHLVSNCTRLLLLEELSRRQDLSWDADKKDHLSAKKQQSWVIWCLFLPVNRHKSSGWAAKTPRAVKLCVMRMLICTNHQLHCVFLCRDFFSLTGRFNLVLLSIIADVCSVLVNCQDFIFKDVCRKAFISLPRVIIASEACIKCTFPLPLCIKH